MPENRPTRKTQQWTDKKTVPGTTPVSLRVIFLNSILMMVMFVAACIIIYRVERHNELELVKEVGLDETHHTSRFIEDWINDQITIVRMIAEDEKIIEACRYPTNEIYVDRARAYLNSVHNKYRYYENLPLAIRLPEGEEIVVRNGEEKIAVSNGSFLVDTVGGRTVGQCGPEYSYIKNIFEGKDFFISEVYPSILRGNPLFVISAPVKDEDGEVTGVAIVAPQMSHFTETFIDSIHRGKTGYMFFVDERKILIAHPRQEWILNENVSHDADRVSERVISGEEVFREIFHDEEKLYVAREIDLPEGHFQTRWFVVFTQTYEEVTAAIKRFLKILIGIGFIFALMYFLSAKYMARIISRQTNTLTSTNIRLNEEIDEHKRVDAKLQAANEKLVRLASVDGLTQVANRRAMDEHLEREWGRMRRLGQPISMIMCDIDYFKKYNDSYGHRMGDECLKLVAGAIGSCVRRSTDMVARYGGEEFAVILPGTTLKQASLVAESIRMNIMKLNIAHLASPIMNNVTLSLGVAETVPEGTLKPGDLVNAADRALYSAKSQGRNRSVSTESIQAEGACSGSSTR